MKIFNKNILKFLKTLLMASLLVVCLAACKSEKGNVTASDVDGKDEGVNFTLDEEQRSCWQGDMLNSFYNVMAESSMRAYPNVTGSAMPLMMVAFALWLSIRVLKHVSSVAEENPAQVWTEVTRMAFVCLVCGMLASSTTFLLFALNKIVLPIYYTFLEYGSRVLDVMTGAGNLKGENFNIQGLVLGDGEDSICMPFTHSLVCQAGALQDATIKASGNEYLQTFPKAPAELMKCLACALSDRMQIGFLLAKNLMGMFTLTSIVCGIIIYVIFAIVKVSFVFYIVDSIFRMNIMVILLPCLILAYPFKYTRKWTKEGFLTILNSAAVLAFLAVLIAMAMLAMQWILIDNGVVLGNKDSYEEFGPVPLALILIAFLILKSTGVAAATANALVGGGGSANFQKKIAKAAAWVAKKVFTFITKGAGKLFLKNPKVKEMHDKLQEKIQKVKSVAGRQ